MPPDKKLFKKPGPQAADWREPLLNLIGQAGIALLIYCVFLILSVFPLPFAFISVVRPAFLLMAVYYWAAFRPQLWSSPGVFAGGVLLDLLSGYPPGLNGVTFVIVRQLVVPQRKFLLGQPFPVVWAGFCLLALGAGFLHWSVFALTDSSLPPTKPVLLGVVLSALLYPLVALALHTVNKRLSGRD